MGARITPLQGSRAAALYYDADPERFTLFKFDTPATWSPPAQITLPGGLQAAFDNIAGYSVATFQHEDVTYIIAANVDRDRLITVVGESEFR